MSETRFTKGPWNVIVAKTWTAIWPHEDTTAVCTLSNRKETTANAHLIAAAPELYEALQQAIGNLEHVSIYDDADENNPDTISARAAWELDLRRFRAALSKALGSPLPSPPTDGRPEGR